MQRAPALTGWSGLPSSLMTRPSRFLAMTPQPAGHSRHTRREVGGNAGDDVVGRNDVRDELLGRLCRSSPTSRSRRRRGARGGHDLEERPTIHPAHPLLRRLLQARAGWTIFDEGVRSDEDRGGNSVLPGSSLVNPITWQNRAKRAIPVWRKAGHLTRLQARGRCEPYHARKLQVNSARLAFGCASPCSVRKPCRRAARPRRGRPRHGPATRTPPRTARPRGTRRPPASRGSSGA